jgi:hypothetical protein
MVRSGRFIAASRVGKRLNTASASAAGATPPSGGAWNAIPPIRIDTSDSVCTRTPVAARETSMPLAFHKRVFAVTYWSKGARTKILIDTPLPSLSSSWLMTSPTGRRRK